MGTGERIYLRVPEVADRLALGRTKVYELIQRGELPSVKIGTALRVPVAAVEDWARRQWDTPAGGGR